MNSPSRFCSSIWLWVYQLIWLVTLPWLALHSRLRPGWWKRLLLGAPSLKADVWIQAASVGEARLARSILDGFEPDRPLDILVTSCTQEGLETLDQAVQNQEITLHTAYFPFDLPLVMRKALKRWRPSLVLLLETEIWPGLLSLCRQQGIPVEIVNARLGRRTLTRYLMSFGLWKTATPKGVHAVSPPDAKRYATLFDQAVIRQMPNIKFDSCLSTEPLPYTQNPLSTLFKAQSQLLVLGSVRYEEEWDIQTLIQDFLKERPRSIIALFPRHLQRVDAWRSRLFRLNLPYVLRSKLQEPPGQGKIIIWDRLGELEAAYALARSVFVGGSLAPLGGQNFLEPLGQGLVPVIGPFWDNFAWVGPEIFEQELVLCGQTRTEVLELLLKSMKKTPNREAVHGRLRSYIASRQGGTQYVRELIGRQIEPPGPADAHQE
jgi:3-deoxy-D-manno-octulosonic-acid transferase